MAKVSFSISSQLAPERILEAATDFTEQRPRVWSGIDSNRYQVHEVGDVWADVTEGSTELGGIWARERYSWEQPGLVRAEVQDSNVFRAGSSWELAVSPRPDGGADVIWTSVRLPKGVKGRVLVAMLAVAGRAHLRGYLRDTLDQIEHPTIAA